MSKCGEKTDVYSRITGYFRPTNHWNKGKLSELADRVMFKVDLAADDKQNAEAADGDENGTSPGAHPGISRKKPHRPGGRVTVEGAEHE